LIAGYGDTAWLSMGPRPNPRSRPPATRANAMQHQTRPLGSPHGRRGGPSVFVEPWQRRLGGMCMGDVYGSLLQHHPKVPIFLYYLASLKIWRRGTDSNPRYGFTPYNGLAPLTQTDHARIEHRDSVQNIGFHSVQTPNISTDSPSAALMVLLWLYHQLGHLFS
jgi:hypothetical protein